MRSRIATIVTMLGLIAGTGGAIALGESGSSDGSQGGASTAQYKPGKGCGKPGQHSGAPGNSGNKRCPTPHKKKPKHKKKKVVTKYTTAPVPRNGSYHCSYRQVGQELIATCRFH